MLFSWIKPVSRYNRGVQIQAHQLHNGTHARRNLPFMIDTKARIESPQAASSLSILSFGCSTGEECVDLADTFPDAKIVGVEINPQIRAKAKRVESSRIRILNSTPETLCSGSPYDIIFAMNVLCFSPQTIGMDNISSLYSFSSFDELIALLDSHLKPGGILGAYNAQYFIEDTTAARRYSPVPHPSYPAAGWIEKCSPNGDRACRTIFHHAGRDYTWSQWDELVSSNPGIGTSKTGRYRQLWIEGRERQGFRPDIGLWQKPRVGIAVNPAQLR